MKVERPCSNTAVAGARRLAGIFLVWVFMLVCGCERVGEIPTDPEQLEAALFKAVKWEGQRRTHALIEAGAKINARDHGGWTPLHYAINRMRDGKFRDMGTIRSLIVEAGADVNAVSNEGFAPVSLAAEVGAIECLDLLLENGADVNFHDDVGMNLLMLAVNSRQTEMAEHLIKRGADVNELMPRGGGALYIAVQRRSPDAVRLLIEHGSEIGGSEKLEAPIIAAASLRNEEVVKLLLAAGADVNAVNQATGITALHRAVASGSPSIISLLLAAGANVNALNAAAATPRALAEQMGDPEVISLLSAGS